MRALAYLFLTTIKNSIKELKKNPGKLVLVIVFAVLLGVALVSGTAGPPSPETGYREMGELYAIVFALYIVSFYLGCMKGLSSGASFYSMADVSHLFLAPISPRRILIYGLVKQMGTTIWIGFFLLFQYGWLSNTYGLSFGGLIAILLGFSVVVFCAQVTAMAIYSYSSGSEGRRKGIKTGLILSAAAVAAGIVLPLLQNRSGNLLADALRYVNAGWVGWTPVFGWMKLSVQSFLLAAPLPALAGIGLTAAYVCALVFAMTRRNADFYEDVLQATEVSFTAITAKKEGQMRDVLPAKVKVGKTGLGRGQGPGAFYYKHLLENRRARLFILDTTSLIFIGTAIVFTVFMRELGIIGIFAFCTYMQIFSSMTGRWLKELLLPYVYMVPESPFRKLLGICRESVLKVCVEAAVLFIPIGLILGLSVPEILACIAARIGFGVLFIAGNILIERVLGSMVSKTLVVFLYFIIMILIAAPGMVLGVAAAMLFPAGGAVVLPMLSMFVWNTLAAVLIVYLCRNILDYAELNNR